MKELHELGAGKLYLHLDGWAEPGYDNNHPDYTPACEEAGGWKAMKELSDTMKEQGDLFGIHDQYRDYYFSAEVLTKTMPADCRTEQFRHIRDGQAGSSHICVQHRLHIMYNVILVNWKRTRFIWTEHIWMCSPVTKEMSAIIRDIV